MVVRNIQTWAVLLEVRICRARAAASLTYRLSCPGGHGSHHCRRRSRKINPHGRPLSAAARGWAAARTCRCCSCPWLMGAQLPPALSPSPAPNLTTTNRSENFRLYLAIVARPHSQTPRSAMAFVYLSRATSPATHSLPRLILKRSGLRIASSSSFRHQKLLEARGNAYCKRSEACTAISREEMAVNCS